MPAPDASFLARHVVVVLVEPIQPGNVGAAARAMKNMGLRRLVLVDPPAFDPHRARWMAPGCDDVLAEARIVATLDEALVGVHRVVATTARHRRGDTRVVEPDAFAASVVSAPEGYVTAVLFGREDHGLPNDAVARAETLLRIPTPEHASLNLAQAVLVVARELFEAARASGRAEAAGRVLGGRTERATAEVERDEPYATVDQLEPAVAELVGLLDAVGYTRQAGPDKVARTVRAALQRAAPTAREVAALRGMIKRVGRRAPGDE